MGYVALYRKWRPTSFKDLVGQEHVSRTLSNAIETRRIGHAYLFSGPRGTGKTSTAKILAKALNCEHGPTTEPCNECYACQKINDGSSMDVYEIDAASNRGIDEIRDLRETVKYAPTDGRYKVYIIDEVHMLTTEAFNALLKTLEEPPSYVVFILATTEAHKVPATIQSRCQRYDFKRITVEDILGRLQLVAESTGLDAEYEALRMIAVRADGGMRDALSILDQCMALTEDKLTAEKVQQLLGLVGREWVNKLAGAIAEHDSALVLKMVDELLQNGKDLQQMLSELSLHFRSVMIYQAAGAMDNVDYYPESEEAVRRQSKQFSQIGIMNVIRSLHRAMNEVKWSPQPRISVEAVLLELCQGTEPAADNANSVLSAGSSVTSATLVAMSSGQTAASNTGNENSRINQLESKLAQLAAMLKNLPDRTAQVANVATNSNAGGKAVPGNKSAAGPMSGSSDGYVYAGSGPNNRNAAIALSGALDDASEGPQPPGPTAETVAIWSQVVDKTGGLVSACLKKCDFLGMDNSFCYLSFKSITSKKMVEAMYKKSIIDTIQKVCGKKLHLFCEFNSGEGYELQPRSGKSAVSGVLPSEKNNDDVVLPSAKELGGITEPEVPKSDLQVTDLSKEDRVAVEKALDAFGGGEFVELTEAGPDFFGGAGGEDAFAEIPPPNDDDFTDMSDSENNGGASSKFD